MIGKSLGERFGLVALAPEKAMALLTDALPRLAKPIVEVRAQNLIACVVLDATAAARELCRKAGLEIKPNGTGVFGLAGGDVTTLFAQLHLSETQSAWLIAPNGPRETKVLLLAGGFALVALDVDGSNVSVRAGP